MILFKPAKPELALSDKGVARLVLNPFTAVEFDRVSGSILKTGLTSWLHKLEEGDDKRYMIMVGSMYGRGLDAKSMTFDFNPVRSEIFTYLEAVAIANDLLRLYSSQEETIEIRVVCKITGTSYAFS